MYTQELPFILEEFALTDLELPAQILFVSHQDEVPAITRTLLVEVGQVKHAVIDQAEVPEVVENELIVA
jgi:hypothetical protein